MAEILKLPDRLAPDRSPDRLLTFAEYTQRGVAPVTMTLAATLRFFKAFDPIYAAATCLLAPGGYEAAVSWWRGHVATSRHELTSRRVAPEEVDRLTAEYLAATRREVQVLKAECMNSDDWTIEMVCAISGESAPRAKRVLWDDQTRVIIDV